MGSRPCLHGVRLVRGALTQGMGPRIREDTGGDGSPSLSSRGQALRRHSRGDGSPRPRGHGWGWVPVPVFTGSGSARALTRGWVSACARTRGERLHPHPSLPPSRGKEKERGWVPASARTRVGNGFPSLSSRSQALRRHSRGDGSPRPRGHEERGGSPSLSVTGGRLFAGIHEGMGHRIFEDTGGEDFTPILAFPLRGDGKREGMGPRPCLHGGQALRRHSRGGWVPASGDLCITTETHSYSGVGRLLP